MLLYQLWKGFDWKAARNQFDSSSSLPPSSCGHLDTFWQTRSFWSWNVAKRWKVLEVCTASQCQVESGRYNWLDCIKYTWLDFTALQTLGVNRLFGMPNNNIYLNWVKRQMFVINNYCYIGNNFFGSNKSDRWLIRLLGFNNYKFWIWRKDQ